MDQMTVLAGALLLLLSSGFCSAGWLGGYRGSSGFHNDYNANQDIEIGDHHRQDAFDFNPYGERSYDINSYDPFDRPPRDFYDEYGQYGPYGQHLVEYGHNEPYGQHHDEYRHNEPYGQHHDEYRHNEPYGQHHDEYRHNEPYGQHHDEYRHHGSYDQYHDGQFGQYRDDRSSGSPGDFNNFPHDLPASDYLEPSDDELQQFGLTDYELEELRDFLSDVNSHTPTLDSLPDIMQNFVVQGAEPNNDNSAHSFSCFLGPTHLLHNETSNDEKPDVAENVANLDDLSVVMNLNNLDYIMESAKQMFNLDIDGLLLDEENLDHFDDAHKQDNSKGDMQILSRRKRSPQPRRSSSSSRSSSSRSSSSRRSSSRSSSSGSSSSGRSSSSSGRRWNPFGSRKPSTTSSSGSSSRNSPSSSGSSSSSSSRYSPSSSTSRNVVAGTAVVGGAAIGGAAIAGATSSGSRPSAPPLSSAPTSGSSYPTASSPYPTAGSPTAGSPYPTSGSSYPTASAPYPTAGGKPTAGSPYPTSGSSYPTASAPYPTAGSPTAGSPYPTSGSSYPTASAPYPTAGGKPTAGSPYPTASSPYPTASAPYPTAGRPTSGSPYPTASAPYPTANAPYPTAGRPTAGSPYPTAGSPYPTAGAPYPTTGTRYPTASAPYPTASAPYPTSGGRPTSGYLYPTSGAPYPPSGSRPSVGGTYPTSGSPYGVGGSTRYPTVGSGYPGTTYGSRGSYPGMGMPTHSNFPKPKKTKSKKVKEAVKAAILGYAIHRTAKKAKKGLFSPSVFSRGRSHHSSSFGHGYGHSSGYGHGYGHGGGYGYGGHRGSSLGGSALSRGGKIAKKILGAYVKIQIAKYVLKFGLGAAQIYFRHKLGYDIREEAMRKFTRQYERRSERRRGRMFQHHNINNNNTSEAHLNITAGEECARVCQPNDTRLCLFTFKVHLYQTLTRACFDCPRNQTDCLRPECITGSGTRRLLTVVNRQLPGPSIEVCMGDRVLVEVYNELPSSGVSLHWHGLTMDADPYMDGVTGLSQCPVQPRQRFTYSFLANFPGTHYWHGQEGLQRGEGLYGPLIVRKEDVSEPNKVFYDHDLSAHVLTFSDLSTRTSEAQFAERFFNEDVPPPAILLINGRGGQKQGTTATLPYARIDVAEGKRYRLRLINAASLNCPMRVVAPTGHNFTVIAADGGNIAAFYTHSLTIYNGERWDVVLTADQTSGLYWLTALGELECEGASQSLVVSYKSSVPDPLMDAFNATNTNASSAAPSFSLTGEDLLDYTEDVDLPTDSPITEDTSVLRANTHNENCSSPNVTCLSEMRSLLYAPLPVYMSEPWVEDTLFLAFGSQPLYNRHFYSLLHYGPEFMPPKKRSKTPQVNNLSLRLPAKPLLLDQSPLKREVCTSEGVRRKHCVGDYCECLHNYEIELGQIIELVLVNEGLKNESVPQPVHLHGYRFWVLSQDVYDGDNNTTDTTTTTETTEASPSSSNNNTNDEDDLPVLESSEEEGFTRLTALNLFTKDKLERNFFHPIMKDTIMIPAGGYAIVRFMAHNRGFWLGESQVLLQAAAGQAFVLQVGNTTQLPSPPQGFPRC